MSRKAGRKVNTSAQRRADVPWLWPTSPKKTGDIFERADVKTANTKLEYRESKGLWERAVVCVIQFDRLQLQTASGGKRDFCEVGKYLQQNLLS